MIERWIADGDDYTGQAAVTGFMEALQNQLGGNDRSFDSIGGTRASDLERWLGSASAKA